MTFYLNNYFSFIHFFSVIIRDFSFDAVIGIGLKGDLVKSLKLNIDLKTLKVIFFFPLKYNN